MVVELNPREPTTKGSSLGAKRIHIGLDYGTFSTKVLIRRRGEKLARVLLLDDAPTPGYPSFATPSAVRIHNNRIYFGRRAVTDQVGTFIKSLKVQLLPHDADLGQMPLDLPPGIGLECLIACYLSWALGQIKRSIGEKADMNVSLNVAAPMRYIVNHSLKRRYLRIVHSAWESVFGHEPFNVTQGSELKSVCEYFTMWLDRDVPDLASRTYEVLPETIAPFVSLSLDPRT
jgi:hypothetical protein